MVEIEGYAAPSEYDPTSYAQVTKVTRAQPILFIAGQVTYDDTGAPPTGGKLRRRRGRCSAPSRPRPGRGGPRDAGQHREDHHRLTDIRYRDELVPIREQFFGKKTPAATQVAVSALGRPEWLIEVEAIAVL
jgi:enamine deaminase RidA (YjgF/YER057c/UK114 family)